MTPRVTMNDTCNDTTSYITAAAAAQAVKPDLSYLPAFNVAGGRPTERYGTRGSFTRGIRIMSGGPARSMPLDAETVDHGKVLFVSSTLKPDLSGEAQTNVAGGRPDERLGSRGRFTPGARRWAGGEPRDVPVELATTDRGIILFPRPPQVVDPSSATGSGGSDDGNTAAGDDKGVSDDVGDAWFFETEDITMEEPFQAHDAALAARIIISNSCSSFNELAREGSDGVFRRCGSDSKFNAGAALLNDSLCRPSF